MADALRIIAPHGDAEMADFRALNWDYRDFLMSLPRPHSDVVRRAYPEDVYRGVLDAAETANRPPLGQMRMALKGRRPLGCGTVQTLAPGDAEIKRVWVAPQARGTGAGRAIMERLIADCRELGFSRILMDTGIVLTAAQALYDRMGFRRRGPYQPVPPETEPLLVYYEMAL